MIADMAGNRECHGSLRVVLTLPEAELIGIAPR